MLVLLCYWIIAGLITFSLTQPTVYVIDVPLETLGEFLLCLLLGGLIVPVLLIGFIIYLIKLLLGVDDE